MRRHIIDPARTIRIIVTSAKFTRLAARFLSYA
jgi:hypothetical protein